MANTDNESGKTLGSGDIESKNEYSGLSLDDLLKKARGSLYENYSKEGELEPLRKKFEVSLKSSLQTFVTKTEKRLRTEFEDKLKEQLNEQKEDAKDFRKNVDEAKLNVIEALGIFAALFTFISVDIQIFKEPVSILSAFGFILAMLGALVIFVLILALLIDKNKNKAVFTKIFILAILLIIAGALAIGGEYGFGLNSLLNLNNNQKDYYTKEETQQVINQTAVQTMDIFKQCVWKQGLSNCLVQ